MGSRSVFASGTRPEERWAELNLSGVLSKGQVPAEVEIVEFGASCALWQVAEEIDLAGIIDGATGKQRHQNLTLGQYLTVAAINRCVDPCSKSRFGHWFARDWLSTQLPVDPKVFNAKTYWNHFQYLALNPIDMRSGTKGPQARNAGWR